MSIFTMSDRLALGAMLTVKKYVLKMLEDIGLIGFNNEPITNLVSPSFSTIDQPAFQMGKKAARLFNQMKNNNEKIPADVIFLRN